jgi:hypothetical protein
MKSYHWVLVATASGFPKASSRGPIEGRNHESDEHVASLIRELEAEKTAQIEGAKVVIKPLTFIAAATVFILCF